MAEPLELTSGELSRLLGVDLKTIHNWVNQGHLQGRRTSGRHLRFDRSQVVRFMRDYEYPIPGSLSETPAQVLLSSPQGEKWSAVRGLKRSSEVVACSDLFETALALGGGKAEVLIVDLEGQDLKGLWALIEQLRQWQSTESIWITGVGGARAARKHLFEVGGDAAIDAAALRQLPALVQWYIGGKSDAPKGVELAPVEEEVEA